MRFSIVILIALVVVGCNLKDRPQMLRKKIIGQWGEINRNKQRLSFDIGLTITDSTVFMTDQPGYFFAEGYDISSLDSISFYEFHGDTLTFKMTLSENADTLRLRTSDSTTMAPPYIQLVRKK